MYIYERVTCKIICGIVAADGADYRQDATSTVLLVIHYVDHRVQARAIAMDCAQLCSSPAPGGISNRCCRTFKSFDRLLHAAHTVNMETTSSFTLPVTFTNQHGVIFHTT